MLARLFYITLFHDREKVLYKIHPKTLKNLFPELVEGIQVYVLIIALDFTRAIMVFEVGFRPEQ